MTRDASFRSAGRGAIRAALSLCCGVPLVGCHDEQPARENSTAPARSEHAVEPARVERPAPASSIPLECAELRPPPRSENAVPETIGLLPPPDGKKIVLAKTDVIVKFKREDFLKTARCLNYEQAIEYVEQNAGPAEDFPIRDAFQLSYVAAALLDTGRASVRLRDETESRKSIVRDAWAADGCAGHCRSTGRLYRLSEDDPAFFLRITDETKNH